HTGAQYCKERTRHPRPFWFSSSVGWNSGTRGFLRESQFPRSGDRCRSARRFAESPYGPTWRMRSVRRVGSMWSMRSTSGLRLPRRFDALPGNTHRRLAEAGISKAAHTGTRTSWVGLGARKRTAIAAGAVVREQSAIAVAAAFVPRAGLEIGHAG